MRHRLQITFLLQQRPSTIDKYGPRKQTSKSIYFSLYEGHLIVARDEAVVAEEEVVVGVEVEEGEAVDAGAVAGKTIESASTRSRNITKNLSDTITAFWD
jgi:hypothetical protein